jgi:CheY-like chemotaxis protein
VTTTLLAVDDSKTMRRVLEITFSSDTFKISVAGNADEAMGKLAAERPAVVLVDASLEGTNGYELCAKVKAAQPGTSVLILSSKHQPYDRNRGTQVGADDFMDKPFDTQQMIDKVATLAKKSASAPFAAPAPAPVAQQQQADASARLRAQTLAYGSQAPGAPSPPAPPVAHAPAAAAPAPQPRPPAPVMPAASPRPAPLGGRANTMIGTPLPAELGASPTRAAPVAVPSLSGGPAPVAAAPAAAAVHALTGNGSEMAQKLGALGLSREQADAVLALSREVVEKVVWEVVPTLAEAMIKEEIRRLTSG